MKSLTVHICLPAYNEEPGIGSLLHEIHNHLEEAGIVHRVIVVDDGSTDHTSARAEEARPYLAMDILRHGTNRGLGDAILTGLRHAVATASENDVIVTMDADNSHTPGLILRMVRLIKEGNDVVIASRYVRGANVKGVSTARRMLSYAASILCRLFFPIKNVKDYTSGYRAYRLRVLRRALDTYGDSFISTSGFSCMLEILLRLRSLDAIMSEAPLILRYDMKEGVSKMKVWRTVGQTLLLILRSRFGRSRPSGHSFRPSS